MDTREGLLISIIDTATIATDGMDQIDLLIAELLTGADVTRICGQMLRITIETRAAVKDERLAAEKLRSGGS